MCLWEDEREKAWEKRNVFSLDLRTVTELLLMNALVATSSGMWSIKLCFNKVLLFITGAPANTGWSVYGHQMVVAINWSVSSFLLHPFFLFLLFPLRLSWPLKSSQLGSNSVSAVTIDQPNRKFVMFGHMYPCESEGLCFFSWWFRPVRILVTEILCSSGPREPYEIDVYIIHL